MKSTEQEYATVKLLTTVLGNFSAISFGVGVYEEIGMGVILGVYSLIFALILMWRVSE